MTHQNPERILPPDGEGLHDEAGVDAVIASILARDREHVEQAEAHGELDKAIAATLAEMPAERKRSIIMECGEPDDDPGLLIMCEREDVFGGPDDGAVKSGRLLVRLTRDGEQAVFGVGSNGAEYAAYGPHDQDMQAEAEAAMNAVIRQFADSYEDQSEPVYGWLKSVVTAAADLSGESADGSVEGVTKTVGLLLDSSVFALDTATTRHGLNEYANDTSISVNWYEGLEDPRGFGIVHQSVEVTIPGGGRMSFSRNTLGEEELWTHEEGRTKSAEDYDSARQSGASRPTATSMARMAEAIQAALESGRKPT